MNGKTDYKPTYTDNYIQHLIHLANDKAKMNEQNAQTARDTLKSLGINYEQRR